MSDSARDKYGLSLDIARWPKHPWRQRPDGSAPQIFAALAVTFGDHDWPDIETMNADAMMAFSGSMGQELLTTRPVADRCYVVYWPGVLEIPWPEGMTAVEAVAAWKAAQGGR